MEKDLQKKCIDYARSLGYMVYSINPPNYKFTTYGTLYNLPDILIVDLNTYFEFKDAEYSKAHKERQEKQAKRRKELWQHGSKAYKVNTFEKFTKIIGFLNGKR